MSRGRRARAAALRGAEDTGAGSARTCAAGVGARAAGPGLRPAQAVSGRAYASRTPHNPRCRAPAPAVCGCRHANRGAPRARGRVPADGCSGARGGKLHGPLLLLAASARIELGAGGAHVWRRHWQHHQLRKLILLAAARCKVRRLATRRRASVRGARLGQRGRARRWPPVRDSEPRERVQGRSRALHIRASRGGRGWPGLQVRVARRARAARTHAPCFCAICVGCALRVRTCAAMCPFVSPCAAASPPGVTGSSRCAEDAKARRGGIARPRPLFA